MVILNTFRKLLACVSFIGNILKLMTGFLQNYLSAIDRLWKNYKPRINIKRYTNYGHAPHPPPVPIPRVTLMFVPGVTTS